MRLLYIEYDPRLQTAVATHLRRASFAVDAVTDGAEGLRLAIENRYDVIILDTVLPSVNGLKIIRHLRHEENSQTPILITSGRDSVEQRVEGLNCGADDYVTKPFAVSEIIARVRALVRRGLQMRNPIIKIDDLRIDTARKLVHRRGKLVDLTVREYALLELLAHRAGHVISRREILERLYDDETSKTSNVVDVYIGYLRRKLNSGRLKDLIHTRRGFGYLIDAPHLEVALRASA